MKHLLFSLFTLAIILLIQPGQAQDYDFSAVAPSGQTLYYNFNNSGSGVTVVRPTIDDYSSIAGDLIIPDTVVYGNAYPVTSIGPSAFRDCHSITSVTIPNTVTSIETFAFNHCHSLASVRIPNSVTTIGSSAFSHCYLLTSLMIPNSVSMIDSYAFHSDTSLANVTIPSSVNFIGNGAFLGWIIDTLNMGHFWPLNASYCTHLMLAHIINIPCGATSNYQNAWGQHNYQEPGANIHLDLSFNDGGFAMILPQYVSNGIYCSDTIVEIQAIADSGYHFLHWNDGNTDNPRTINLTQDTSFAAQFVLALTPPICMVTVENDHNVILWEKDQTVASYQVYREGNTSGVYELLSTVPYDSLSAWEDTSSHPRTRSYRYRLSATNIYGHESELSVIHKTMHLTIGQGLGTQWNLVWTEYEGADYTTYVIYRGTDPSNIQLIDVMPSGGNTTYTDVSAPAGNIYYQVGIMLTTPCNPTKSENIVLSNIATNVPLGISDVVMSDLQVFAHDGQLVVSGECHIKDLQVFDISGKLLKTVKVDGNNIFVDISDFSTGVYFVRTNTEKGPVTRKVVR